MIRISASQLIVASVLFAITSYAGDDVATSFPPIHQGRITADASQSVAVDPSGNVYVTGNFSDTVDFNPGLGADVRTSAGNDDVFVTRFNADGSYAWTQTFGGAQNDNAYAVTVTATKVYVAGFFSGSGVGIGGAGSISSSGSNDAFVMALDASTGQALTSFSADGVQIFGGTQTEGAYGLALSGTTLFVSGRISSTDAGVGGIGTITTTGSSDAFVLALNADTGTAVTTFSGDGVQTFGGTFDDYAYGITVFGNTVYVCGHFSSMNAGVGGTGIISSSGQFDAFVLALDATTGAAVTTFSADGVQTLGGSNNEFGYGVAASATTVYVSGSFQSANAGVGGIGAITTQGSADAFVLALNRTNGAALTAFSGDGVQTFGGTSSDEANGITIVDSTVFVSGYFSGKAGIGGPGNIAPVNGIQDVFVMALNANNGNALTTFSGDGVQTFGGSQIDYGASLSVFGTKLYVNGFSSSINAGIGGVGKTNSIGFLGFLLSLNTLSGEQSPLPFITSSLVVGTGVNENFSYVITTSVAAESSNVYLLPPGLNFSNGIISGKPSQIGTFVSVLEAKNTTGTVQEKLTIHVIANAIAASYPPVRQGDVPAASHQTLALDDFGNRYVVGIFAGVKDFDPGLGFDVHVSAGGDDVYITRFNSNGTYAWTQTFGGSFDDFGRAIFASGTTIYVSGFFRSNDAGFGGTGVIGTFGDADVFVLALDSATGSPLLTFSGDGVQVFGGNGIDSANGIAVAGGTVYVCGDTTSTNAGIAGTGSATANSFDAFVIALDGVTGAAKTSFSGDGIQTFGGTFNDFANAICVSSTTVYVTGDLQSTDAGVGGTGSISSTGDSDAFVLALDRITGAPVTAFSGDGVQVFGGTSSDSGTGISLSDGKIYVCGSIHSVDAGFGATGSIASSGDRDAFVFVLDSASGLPVSTFSTDGVQTFGGGASDVATCVTVAGNTVYVAGTFQSGDAGIGSKASVFTIGGTDVFVIALDQATGTAKTSFSTDGIQTFGGVTVDYPAGLAVSGTTVYVSGFSNSANAGVGGVGIYNLESMNGFLLALNSVNGEHVNDLQFKIESVFGGDIPTHTAGTAVPIKITAVDSRGQTVTAFQSTVTLSSNGILSQGGGTTAAFVNGVLASHLITYQNDGTFTVIAVSTGSSEMGASNAFVVNRNPNTPPVFVSGLTTTPSPAITHQPIQFEFVAFDAEQDSLITQIDYGDGISGTSTVHIYEAPGTYVVTCSISDGLFVVASSTTVRVYLPSDPDLDLDLDGLVNSVDLDNDEDGVPDAIELFAGTDPNDADSTLLTANNVSPLLINSLSIKLNFSKPQSDSVRLAGSVYVPPGLQFVGQRVILDVGGVMRAFILNEKGQSPKAVDSFAVAVKSKNGIVREQIAAFRAGLNKGTFATSLQDEGLTDSTLNKVTRSITVNMIFNSAFLQTVRAQTYSAKAGKAGRTK